MKNKEEEYQILQELEKGLFEIQFTETTNIRLANKGQITRGTCYDLQKTDYPKNEKKTRSWKLELKRQDTNNKNSYTI